MARRVSLRSAALGCVASAALLQACASTSPAPKSAPTPPPAVAPAAPPVPPPPQSSATPGLTPRERAQKIVALLNDGQREQARAEAVQLLQDTPGDVLAQSLFDQIDKDPKLLLGEKNFPYKLQPGDSLSSLAQRFLGDHYLFYALARYNNIDKPSSAEVGRTILIPGVPGKAATRPSRPNRQEGEEESRSKKPAAPSPAAPSPPMRDPARAASLRGQALTALNGGAADRAVALLRQAAGLDPDNAAIKRDLARAERIQATLHR